MKYFFLNFTVLLCASLAMANAGNSSFPVGSFEGTLSTKSSWANDPHAGPRRWVGHSGSLERVHMNITQDNNGNLTVDFPEDFISPGCNSRVGRFLGFSQAGLFGNLTVASFEFDPGKCVANRILKLWYANGSDIMAEVATPFVYTNSARPGQPTTVVRSLVGSFKK
jgi:hypothetical protein